MSVVFSDRIVQGDMSAPQAEIHDLADQFAYELRMVYDMEVKLVDALDDMSRLATNDNISKGFATHRDETETQVQRVEDAFAALGEQPTRQDNAVVDGLLEEKEQYEASVVDDTLRNLYYLNAAMKTERIEITSYEGLLMTAEKAGLGDDVTDPLEDNLEEEEKTLRKLQGLSTGSDLKTLWDKLTGS